MKYEVDVYFQDYVRVDAANEKEAAELAIETAKHCTMWSTIVTELEVENASNT